MIDRGPQSYFVLTPIMEMETNHAVDHQLFDSLASSPGQLKIPMSLLGSSAENHVDAKAFSHCSSFLPPCFVVSSFPHSFVAAIHPFFVSSFLILFLHAFLPFFVYSFLHFFLSSFTPFFVYSFLWSLNIYVHIHMYVYTYIHVLSSYYYSSSPCPLTHLS